ncbi:uncharacterized protein LOC120278835 isoform X2 [Dioscorea cayenensis subsp. rotundata]|uniref:Uncharacterized protein LOC120278835 isoform X2 n=1 Tax=Dioscorea cayennensis subsp. rotundata TaxID=55577 RepID=A0AB40CSJ6_DIOCR|nr:uncharacterized protein LOC120278835 isoform X2 [Dioscorea cayenensis subsp. rotundata]
MENRNAITSGQRENLGFALENPFSFKVGQVFTGFGVGCGVGIGVGRPIYLGAIPMVQQVLTATRGATDVLSGVGRHVNGSLKKFGVKNVEAGVGCGVGFGHGFGIGLALKPGVIQRVQSSIALTMAKIMMRLGIAPKIPSIQNIMPGSFPSNSLLSGASDKSVKSSIGSVLNLGTKTTGSTQQHLLSDSPHQESISSSPESKETSSLFGSRSVKVINEFLQNPVLNKEETEAENLHAQNNVLQMLLKHQQVIEQLIEENQMLRRVLTEDLHVQPSKLCSSREIKKGTNYQCPDCFECRRRERKSAR